MMAMLAQMWPSEAHVKLGQTLMKGSRPDLQPAGGRVQVCLCVRGARPEVTGESLVIFKGLEL